MTAPLQAGQSEIDRHTSGQIVTYYQYQTTKHIIRNDRELTPIHQYITDNPSKWQLDRDNSQNLIEGGYQARGHSDHALPTHLPEAIDEGDHQINRQHN